MFVALHTSAQEILVMLLGRGLCESPCYLVSSYPQLVVWGFEPRRGGGGDHPRSTPPIRPIRNPLGSLVACQATKTCLTTQGRGKTCTRSSTPWTLMGTFGGQGVGLGLSYVAGGCGWFLLKGCPDLSGFKGQERESQECFEGP